MELNFKKVSTVFHAANFGVACVQSITENPLAALCGFAFRGLMFEITKRVIRATSSATSSSVEEEHA